MDSCALIRFSMFIRRDETFVRGILSILEGGDS